MADSVRSKLSVLEWSAVLAIALSLAGCGTIASWIPASDVQPSPYYRGVEYDLGAITDPSEWGLYRAIMAIDLPISAIVDTVLLPVYFVVDLVGA